MFIMGSHIFRAGSGKGDKMERYNNEEEERAIKADGIFYKGEIDSCRGLGMEEGGFLRGYLE
jgi:hypothetical protein